MSANDADCVAVIGSTGMGKGLFLVANITPLLGQGRALLVWSPLEATDDYAGKFGGAVVRAIPDLVSKIKAGVMVLVFVPSEDPKIMKGQFDLFCRIAWQVPNSIVVVEELSRVTAPSFAPLPWKNLSTAGRHQGIKLYGLSQRPAHMDKDFFGACTEIRAYRVGYDDDAKALQSVLREPWDKFMMLEKFHYVHLWKDPRRKVQGVQPLPGQSAPAVIELEESAGIAKSGEAPAASPKPASKARKKAKRRKVRRAPATK